MFSILFNPFLTKALVFTCLHPRVQAFSKHWEKEKLQVTSSFPIFHILYPFGDYFAIFIQFEIVVCKLLQFRRVQN